MGNDYLDVTELAGDEVSREQIERICHRYYWAGTFCHGKDVLEAACGTGQGLGFLASCARSLKAGDYSPAMVERVLAHYENRVDVRAFDAQVMPFANKSLDVVLLFEAIYYLPSADRFLEECKRVLRPGGQVLITTANKDLFDFNPSPHSYSYYGVVALDALFRKHGFSNVRSFGYFPVASISWRQKLFRPIKMVVSRLGLIPRTMKGKKFLKRLVFGELEPMPAEIQEGMASYVEPTLLPSDRSDICHKVIYCAANLL